jgi:hypothetical protein
MCFQSQVLVFFTYDKPLRCYTLDTIGCKSYSDVVTLIWQFPVVVFLVSGTSCFLQYLRFLHCSSYNTLETHSPYSATSSWQHRCNVTAMQAPWKWRYSSCSFLISALDGVSGQRHAPAALTPGKNTAVTHWTGDWVGLRGSLDTEDRRKILCFCQGLNPGHPVCSQTPYWLSYPS